MNYLHKQSKKSSNDSWRKKSKLTTWLGKRLEHTTYTDLAICIFSILVFSALYFWIASPYNSGTNKKDISFFDSIYFSVITFTTLGYGDIFPLGFGKIVASIEVLAGLFLVALFVGKVASERQSALLLLLYTSEHQRRLKEFTRDINALSIALSEKLVEHDHKGVFNLVKQSVTFLASISNYLSFQSNQGGLANFGNISALRALYRSVASIQLQAIKILKIQETEASSRNRLEQINERAIGIYTGMIRFHTNDIKTINQLNHIKKQYDDYKNWLISVEKGKIQMNHNGVMNEFLIEQVKNILPAHPWPKNVHKIVASKLKITNKLAQKCIVELISKNTWPDFTKKNEK